jgi:uracil-DNA glycosylase family 4
MDAREQLRQYLEQRREAGERELVLDQLSVEEAMRLMGAGGGARQAAQPAAPSRPKAETPAPTAPTSDDWRKVLRESGAAPDAPAEVPVVREPVPAAPSASPDKIPPGISVGSPDRSLFNRGAMAELESLDAVAAAVAKCTKCPLHSTAKNPVPGSGNPKAKFMVVGEAPGQSEDEQGLPFVGAAGQLLTKILAAVDLDRDKDVFICNVLKHRPPGNRNPEADEVTACRPFLARQFELLQPKVILALGTFAAQTLLESKLAIGKLRGQLHRYHGVPLIVTYHPAALLRNPSWKRPTWEDVQLARRILDSAVAEP